MKVSLLSPWWQVPTLFSLSLVRDAWPRPPWGASRWPPACETWTGRSPPLRTRSRRGGGGQLCTVLSYFWRYKSTVSPPSDLLNLAAALHICLNKSVGSFLLLLVLFLNPSCLAFYTEKMSNISQINCYWCKITDNSFATIAKNGML